MNLVFRLVFVCIKLSEMFNECLIVATKKRLDLWFNLLIFSSRDDRI